MLLIRPISQKEAGARSLCKFGPPLYTLDILPTINQSLQKKTHFWYICLKKLFLTCFFIMFVGSIKNFVDCYQFAGTVSRGLWPRFRSISFCQWVHKAYIYYFEKSFTHLGVEIVKQNFYIYSVMNFRRVKLFQLRDPPEFQYEPVALRVNI